MSEGIRNSVSTEAKKVRALDANSLTGLAIGGPQWRRHILRAGLSYSAPRRFHLATTYGFQSGVWSGPVVTRISAPDARFGPPTVQLTNGRVVENPLATTIRFAFATRGDGQFTLPGIHTWNIRGGYEFGVPGRRSRIEVLADVFNVLNLGAFQGFLFGGNQLYSFGRLIQKDVRIASTAFDCAG